VKQAGGVWYRHDDLPHIHRHQDHRVVAEDVDYLHGPGIAARLDVGVRRRDEFQLTVLAGAEALPFVLEDVAAGPAFFERALTLNPCPGGRGTVGNVAAVRDERLWM